MAFRLLPADDIFISYPRKGASTYASGLADELLKRGFSPFVDKFDTKPSPVLTEELRRKIRECKMLIIIGTRRAGSRPMIEAEIIEYLKTGRRTIVPIDFNNATPKAHWYPLIEGIPLEPESRVMALKDGNPSVSVLNRIEKQFTYKRGKESQRRTTMALATMSIFFTLVSFAAAMYAAQQVGAAERARTDAIQSREDAAEALRERDAANAERNAAQQERDSARTEAATAKGEAATANAEAAMAKVEAKKQTKIAEQRKQEADAEAKRAAAQEASARTSLARLYDTRAEAAVSSLLALAWGERAVQESPEGDGARYSYMSRVMDLALQAPLSVFNLPLGSVPRDLSPSGDIVVTTSDEHKFALWDWHAGTPLPHPYPDPAPDYPPFSQIRRTAFSQDSRRAAELVYLPVDGRNGRHLRVWDVRTGVVLLEVTFQVPDEEYPIEEPIVFSPDGEDVIVFTAFPARMLIWNIATCERREYERSVPREGRLLVKGHLPISRNPGRNWFIDSRNDGQVTIPGHKSSGAQVLQLREIKTGRVLREIPLAAGPESPGTESALEVEFTPDAGKLLILSTDGFRILLRLWDVTSGGVTEPKFLPVPFRHFGSGQSDLIGGAITPDGKRLLVETSNGLGAVSLWDISGETPVKESEFYYPDDPTLTPRTALLTDDGEYVIGVSSELPEQKVSFWSVRTLNLVSRPLVIQSGSQIFNISTRDKTVTIFNADGALERRDLTADGSLWTFIPGAPESDTAGALCSALTPDRTALLTVKRGAEGQVIELWDAQIGARKWRVDAPYKHFPGEIIFSDDGERFVVLPLPVAGSGSRYLGTEDSSLRVRRTSDGALEPGFSPVVGFMGGVEFSRDGTSLVTGDAGSASSDVPVLERRSVTTGESLPGGRVELSVKEGQIWLLTRFGEYLMKIEPGDKPLITLLKASEAQLHKLAELRFASKGMADMAMALFKQARELRFTRANGVVAVLDSGATISVTASPSGALMMNEREKVRLTPPSDSIPYALKMVFSPDGRRIAAFYLDSGRSQLRFWLRVWDSTTGLPLSEPLWHESPVNNYLFTADSMKLLTVSQSGVLRSWFFGYFKNDTPKWMTYIGEALSGLRVINGKDVQRVPYDEHVKFRREFSTMLHAAAAAGDERARSLLIRQSLVRTSLTTSLVNLTMR